MGFRRFGVMIGSCLLAAIAAAPAPADEPPPGERPTFPAGEAAAVCGANVCAHYSRTGADRPDLADGDGNGRPDGVERVVAELEKIRASVEAPEPDGLGWRPAVLDETLGGGPQVDVYLRRLESGGGAAIRDSGQSGCCTRHGFITIDSGFAQTIPGDRTLPFLLAHEYAHLSQFAYNGFAFDRWLSEAQAQWLAEELDDRPGGSWTSLGSWSESTETPLASPNREAGTGAVSRKAYGTSVWLRWVSDRYGARTMRRTLEETAARAPLAFSPDVLDTVIRSAGGPGFAEEIARFSTATAEWRTGATGFSEGGTFPDVERVGRIAPESTAATVSLDHTVFALLDVTPRASGPVNVSTRFPAGLRAYAALTGRREDGTTEQSIVAADEQGAARVSLSDAAFERVTIALVNADTRRPPPPSYVDGEWRYAADRQSAQVELLPEPAVAPSPSDSPAIPSEPGQASPGPAPTAPTVPGARDRRALAVRLTLRPWRRRSDVRRGIVARLELSGPASVSVRASDRRRPDLLKRSRAAPSGQSTLRFRMDARTRRRLVPGTRIEVRFRFCAASGPCSSVRRGLRVPR